MKEITESETIASSIEHFYAKSTLLEFEGEIMKLLTEQAKDLAKKIVDKYEIKQHYIKEADTKLGAKLVLITELEVKK